MAVPKGVRTSAMTKNGGKRYYYIRQIDRPFTFSDGTGNAP